MKRIIYPTESGIAVITPFLGSGVPIEEIARKDVPAGAPFCIVDTTDLPPDRSQRDAWKADFSAPDGYGADYGVGTSRHVTGYDKEGNGRSLFDDQTGYITRRSTRECREGRAAVTQNGQTKIIIRSPDK